MKIVYTILFLFVIPRCILANDTSPKYTVIERDNKKGLSDFSGNIIIPPAYDDLGWSTGPPEVHHDRIGFKDSGKWGILNLRNEKLTTPRFLSLKPCNDEIFIASIPDQYKISEVYGLVNYDGKSISDFLFNTLENAGDYFIAGIRKSSETRYGVLNDKGKVTVPIKYSACNFIGHDLFALSDEDNNILLHNGTGILLTKFIIDSIGSFEHGLAIIKSRGKLGIINTSGNTILQPEFKQLKVDENGNINYLPYDDWKQLKNSGVARSLKYDSIIPIRQHNIVGFASDAINFLDSAANCTASFYNLKSESFVNHEIIAKEKSKYGLLDSSGKIIYPFTYDSIVSFPGYVLLKRRINSESGWVLGNHWGEIINYGPFEEFYPANNAYVLGRRKGYWGLIYSDGKEQINCIYDSIREYVNGLMKVTFHNETGLLWKNNWLIYPGKYQLTVVPGQKIIVSDFRGSSVLNILGDTLFHSENILSPLSNYFIDRSPDGLYGLLTQNFDRVIYPVCYHINALPGDSIFVYRTMKGWGAINDSGKTLFNNIPDPDTIISFSEGFFKVNIEGRSGFIDQDGKLRIANRYEDAGEFMNGIVSVKLLDRWGFINKDEKLVIQPFYDTVLYQKNELIIVCKNQKFGIIDRQGDNVLEMDYDEIIPANDLGYFCKKSDMVGYINNDGKMTVIPRFNKLEMNDDGTLIAMRNNKYGLLSVAGETIIPVIYDKLIYNVQNHQLWGCIKAEWQTLSVL